DDVQQRRLAGPRGAHDGDELPLLDVDVDAAQHVAAAGAVRVRLLDVAQRNQRVGGERLGFDGASGGGGRRLRASAEKGHIGYSLDGLTRGTVLILSAAP